LVAKGFIIRDILLGILGFVCEFGGEGRGMKGFGGCEI